jgi:hypothetical protein
LSAGISSHVHAELETRCWRWSPANVGAFLAALKLFYSIMRELGCYASDNPLVDVASQLVADVAYVRRRSRQRCSGCALATVMVAEKTCLADADYQRRWVCSCLPSVSDCLQPN